MSKHLSVGILGTGFMGGLHAQRLMKQPGVSLAAICGETVAMAQDLKSNLKAADAAVYGDFDEMLAKSRLDALYVCIPPFAHAGQVEKAAGRGIALFLEKPIAYDLQKAEAMVADIDKAGVVSHLGYHMRFRKAVTALKAMQPGQPTLFEGRFWCNLRGHPWWSDVSKSHGQIFEQVIHLYDLALYLFGRVESAAGFTANLCHAGEQGYTIEDTSVGMLRFQNGALGMITGSNCSAPERFIGSFRAVFENATLDYRSTGDWRVRDESTLFVHDGKTITEQKDFVEDNDVYLDETSAFLAALRGEGPQIAPARQGLEGIRLVSAVLESASQRGSQIKLP